MAFNNYISYEAAKAKIEHYCAYQERCHYEVKEKLYSFKLNTNEVEEILSQLISDSFLNEERFAAKFAHGKFVMKQWGKNKIKYALQQKRVSPRNITDALDALNMVDYINTLNKLLHKKWQAQKNDQYIVREVKCRQYLLQKGYEAALITKAIAALKAQKKQEQ